MRNIITGINAADDVNVQDLFIVGREVVKQMESQPVFEYSYRRKNKVTTLASARFIKVTVDRVIDSALLFQRYLVVSQSGDLCLEEVMKYEFSPYPPSLFEGKYILRKPDKPDEAILQFIPRIDPYVLDGGSLLHRLKWKEGSTYSSIASNYASFTVNKYGKATIVFDGYGGGPSTKDNAYRGRYRSAMFTTVSQFKWLYGPLLSI